MKASLFLRNRMLFLGDLFFIFVSVLGSFVLRLNLGPLLIDHVGRAMVMLGLALVIKPVVYYGFGLYRRMWIYASTQELKLIIAAVTTGSILVSVVITILQFLEVFPGFSRGVLVIDWMLSLLAVGGLRFSLRILSEYQGAGRAQNTRAQRVLVVGAGDAGALVVREMQKTPRSELAPVCFVDDDPAKQQQEIHGVPVAGTLKELSRVIKDKRIDEVIVAIPSAPGSVIRSVMEVCRSMGIPFRTMPSLHELIGGKVSVNRLREVQITDLLRREPVQIDDQLVGTSINGRRVLITGAGGSIGREMCRQVARWTPRELVLLGHGENSIFETMLELEASFPSLPLHPVIADIRDAQRLDAIFESHHPQLVFHTAAHKHVPLMEANVEEAVTNNISGTRNVVEAALARQVSRLVLISSDKAVCPSNVYGASKRLSEMLVLDAARRSGQAFTVVRFGNVLGSRGSIVPIFKRQIDQGGPITITHPDMQRYFMTIPEAVHLVLQAAAMGQGGETFVLNMGQPVRILELAEDLIRLSGLEPGQDIEIVFTGIRPGEKLSEELWDNRADFQNTIHPDIFSVEEIDPITGVDLQKVVDELVHLARQSDSESILRILDEVVPGAAVRSSPPPDLTAIL